MIREARLHEILSETGEMMGISFVKPSIRYKPQINGTCVIDSLIYTDQQIQVLNPRIELPDLFIENELATQGVIAHEGGHIKLMDSYSHRLYLWMRERPMVHGQYFILPFFLLMYFIEENRADNVAKHDGLSSAVNECRKYVKNGIMLGKN